MRSETYDAAESLARARRAWWEGGGTYSEVIDAVDVLLAEIKHEAVDELMPAPYVDPWSEQRLRDTGQDWGVNQDSDGRCVIPQPTGWYCRRRAHADGPCASLPKWWNLSARWRYREMLRPLR